MRLFDTPITGQYPLTPEQMLLMLQKGSGQLPVNPVNNALQPMNIMTPADVNAKYPSPIQPIQANMVTGSQPPINPWGPELNKPYEAPTAVAPPVAAKPLAPIDPNSYLGGLLANSAPKPKYNQKSEDQLRNMAKAQKIGEFLGLLGDVYGTAKGAPVQRRESTSAAPYMQSILARQDKYQDQLDQFDKQEYLRKLQIGQAYDANKDKQYNRDYAEQKFAADQEYKQYLLLNKLADSKESKRRFDVQQSQKDEDQKIALIRANKTGAGKESKLKKIQTSKQVHELTPENYNMIKREVLTNIDKYKEKYSNWFVEKPEMIEDPKSGEQVPTGKTTIQLRPQIKEDELVGAYLEEQDNPTPDPKPGTPEYFDKIRTEKGMPTSTDPIASPTAKQEPTAGFSEDQEKQLSILQKNNPQLTRQQIIDLISK